MLRFVWATNSAKCDPACPRSPGCSECGSRPLRPWGQHMRNRLIVTAALAAACLAGLGLRPAPPAAADEPTKRLQWEYRVYYHTDLMALGANTANANLTKLGTDG